MPMKTWSLPYGRDHIDVCLPDATTALLPASHAAPLLDPVAAVRQSLETPIGSPSLAQCILRKKPRSVAITISDITRPVPNEVVLTALLEVLNGQGIGDEQVVVIIGTGMHRPSTADERLQMLGASLVERLRIEDHRADDAAGLVKVSDDPPIAINRLFEKADFRIVTGLIEPHFMAGYSGGRKGVCPALVDLATIQRFHGYTILSDPRSTAGVLQGNPCHAESLRVAQRVGVDFLVNVAIGEARRVTGVFAGDLIEAHEAGCAFVAGQAVRIEEPFDLVVTNAGGYPLDQTFYQTVKGMVAALPALHAKSTLLIVSHCGEGVGSQTYARTMAQWHGDWRGFLKHIQSTSEVTKDQWQYQMHARVLERIGRENLHLASDGLPSTTQSALAVNPVLTSGDVRRDVAVFLESWLAAHPTARVAVIPEGPYTLLL